MRIVYLGNGPFAAPALEAIAKSPHEVLAVVARPDLPSGKHQRIEPGPVASLARRLSLPLHQPPDVNAAEVVGGIGALRADLLVVADFGQILSKDLLATTPRGGINLHASLLPKYRGAAPIAWAIYHGETETGVTILQVTPQLDAGGMILQRSIPIGPEQTTGEVEAELAVLGAEMVLEAIALLERGEARPIAQDPARATKAPRLKKEDGRLDWRRPARRLADQVRAMIPWPVAFAELAVEGEPPVRLQILKAQALPVCSSQPASPGAIVEAGDRGLVVATGEGALAIRAVKPAGKRAMSAEDFLRGNRLEIGQRFLLEP